MKCEPITHSNGLRDQPNLPPILRGNLANIVLCFGRKKRMLEMAEVLSLQFFKCLIGCSIYNNCAMYGV